MFYCFKAHKGFAASLGCKEKKGMCFLLNGQNLRPIGPTADHQYQNVWICPEVLALSRHDMTEEPEGKRPQMLPISFTSNVLRLPRLAARSLQCSRLRVHKNLVASLIIHSILLAVISFPAVLGPRWTTYSHVVSRHFRVRVCIPSTQCIESLEFSFW